jgi:hypothetical protein
MSERYRKPWTYEDISKLKSMAQRFPTAQIAQELGRGISATVMKAHELQLSLRMKPKKGSRDDVRSLEPGPAGMDLS